VIDGCFMALFNVEAFRPLVEFRREVRGFAEHVKSSAPAAGSAGIFYPGERSHLNAVRRATDGVEIPDWAWNRVLGYARAYGLEEYIPAPVRSPAPSPSM
jgi:uncharacterized oxidoreductase